MNFCFVWFTDFLFAWSSLWRCFSVFYCIFITFNPLEAISCALSLCVQKRLLFAPAEPKFKTWIKPYGVGEDGHPVKPLAETMLNKAPETCTLALAMQKKNYRSSVVVQPTFPSCVLFLCLAVSKFLSTETCQLSRPSSNLTFARTQSSPTLALQFDHPPIWPYDGTPRNLIWPSKRNPETCIPRFGKPLPRGRKTSCNWTRIC